MAIKFQVLWTHTAEKDLTDIIRHIAEDNAPAAVEILNKIQVAARRLENFPDRGRFIPELKKQGIGNYRELIVSPWRIMYRVAATDVFVLSVIDGRMNVEDVLLNRFLSTN